MKARTCSGAVQKSCCAPSSIMDAPLFKRSRWCKLIKRDNVFTLVPMIFIPRGVEDATCRSNGSAKETREFLCATEVGTLLRLFADSRVHRYRGDSLYCER